MPARLVPLTPGTPPIPLRSPITLIGRLPGCDVTLGLAAVSRRHCCLALADGRLLIRDLGSRHGVRVNGLPVDEARLNAGDEIAIGPLIYRLDVTD